jgi:DNA-directed RNA polymerase subunit beta'
VEVKASKGQDPGDTLFLEDQLIHTKDFIVENDKIIWYDKLLRTLEFNNLKEGQIVTPRELRDEIRY